MMIPGSKLWFGLVLVGLGLVGGAVFSAQPGLSLSLQRLSSESWIAEDIQVTLATTPSGLSARFMMQRFAHPAFQGDLKGVVVDCPELIEDEQGFRCPSGHLTVRESAYGPQTLDINASYSRSGAYTLKVRSLQLFGGAVTLDMQGSGDAWNLELQAKPLELNALSPVYPGLLPGDSSLSGRAGISLRLQGDAQGVVALKGNGRLDGLNYSDGSGLHVAEAGAGRWTLDATRRGRAWKGRAELQVDSGMYYSDPFYLEVAQTPVKLHLQGEWTPAASRVRLDDAGLQFAPMIQAQGQASIDLAKQRIDEARLSLSSTGLQGFYKTLLQPLLIGSLLDELELSGGMQADLRIEANQLSALQAGLHGVTVNDRKGLFSARELQGRLLWPHAPEASPSELQLAGGALYGIDLGPMHLRFTSDESSIRTLEPVTIPLLQGRLSIDRFEARDPFGGSPVWQTGAKLTDLSLTELSQAFGWPALSGSLNGSLPAMNYRDHSLSLDGALQVDVFDGQVTVDDLVIRNPLGRVPELFADAEFRHLNLAPITQTFSFGHMEGGLEGWVRDLHLISWEPVAFQALLQTPQDDPLTHRISQRAIDDLTALGNGVGSGLSKTFMGIFKEFRYNRMMLRVALTGDQAELDGIPHGDGGYYLVEGAGLPRIDVIARNRRVAWKTLLARLRNIRVEGVQVK
ncbi:MAG: hypothetical protein ABW076_00310 [Candidatus Thiodiazotropha sp.]